MIFRLIVLLLGLAAGTALIAPDALARDIRLGGDKGGPKRPGTTIELPGIVISMRKEDGGWHHVKIRAWLASKDLDTAQVLDGKRTVIVRSVRERIPDTDFETLADAHTGSSLAKEVIKSATEQSLGHPWNGDVLIRELLVY